MMIDTEFNNAYETLKRFARYDYTESVDFWNALLSLWDCFRNDMSQDFLNSLEVEILSESEYILENSILVEKETETRKYFVVEEK